MSVRIRCDRCESIARIESSSEISPTYKKLYCSCRNPECGHTWVMDLQFSHTLSPSALDLPETLREKIQAADNRRQQVDLLKGISG